MRKIQKIWDTAHNWGALLYLLVGALVAGFLELFDKD